MTANKYTPFESILEQMLRGIDSNVRDMKDTVSGLYGNLRELADTTEAVYAAVRYDGHTTQNSGYDDLSFLDDEEE